MRPIQSILKFRPLARLGLPSAERSIMLAPLVGVVAGLGAILFHAMCLALTHLALTTIAGYDQGRPGNEGGYRDLFGQGAATEVTAEAANTRPALADQPTADNQRSIKPWLLVLVATAGGLVSGFIVYRFAPEAQGHGTDAAIDAYHNKRGAIRGRVPLVKMISSAITLGTGGSGGREGPIAQIGAGFGSFLAGRLKLSDTDRRILMAAGIGAGIGAIFHAPLAGAIFAIEVLYRDPDFEAEALIPAFIATTVSYSVFSIVMLLITQHHAFHPLFDTPEGLHFNAPILLVPLTVLAVAMAIASWGYVKCFYGIHRLFTQLRLPNALKPAIGAALTGLLALIAYYTLRATSGDEAATDSLSVLSFGYGFLQKIINPGDAQLLMPVLLVVGLGKILTTSLTIGSGGSGGVFGPSMVIGGSLGTVVGMLFTSTGLVNDNEVVIFTLLGMASFFAAAANAPVSTLIMVSELTASYVLLLPSMWVCALAYMLSRGWTLYSEQVKSRLESPAHRGDFIIDVLEGMSVRQAMEKVGRTFVSVPPAMPLKEMDRLLTGSTQICFPVVDEAGKYCGLFGLNDIRQFLYDQTLSELAVAQDLMTQIEPLTMDTNLSGAIGHFAQSRFEELVVVEDDQPDQVIGLLRRQDVIAAYSSQLMALRQR